MGSVEVGFSGAWREQLEGLGDFSERGLATIRGYVDLVVDGHNLTSSLPECGLFSWLTLCLKALLLLQKNASPKEIIVFPQIPWEMVLCRRGPRACLVSLYSTGELSRVVVHNREIPAQKLVESVLALAGSFSSDCDACASARGATAGTQALVELSRGLQPGPFLPNPGPDERLRCEHPDTAFWDMPLEKGATLFLEVDRNHEDLRRFGGGTSFDLHALLCNGRIGLKLKNGEELLLERAYPIVGAYLLLSDAERAVRTLEQPHGGNAAFPGKRFGVVGEREKVRFSADRAELPVQSGGIGRLKARRRQQPVVEEDTILALPAANVVACVVDMILALCSCFHQANPHTVGEKRLLDLAHRSYNLRARLERLRVKNQFAPSGQSTPPAPFEHKGLEPAPTTLPFDLDTVHNLQMRLTWHAEVEAALTDLVKIRGQSVIGLDCRGGVQGIHLNSGELLWRHEGNHGELLFPYYEGDTLLLTYESGWIASVDPDTGRELWSFHTGVERGIERLKRFETERGPCWTLASEESIQVFEEESGAVVFSVPWGHGPTINHAVHNHILAVVGGEGDLCGIDTRSGEVLWRLRLDFAVRWVEPCGDLLLVHLLSVNVDSADLLAIDVQTGKTRWRGSWGFRPVHKPVAYKEHILMAYRRRGFVGVCCVCRQSGELLWSSEVPSYGGSPTEPLLYKIEGRALVAWKCEDGVLYAHDARNGAKIWSAPTHEPDEMVFHNLSLTWAEGAIVSAGVHTDLLDPLSGRILQRLKNLPSGPSGIWSLGELRFLVGDMGESGVSDVLELYEPAYFLALVRPAQA